MVAGETLAADEVLLLGHYRRLKRDAHDFKLEVFGGFKEKVRTVEVRPCAYYRLAIPLLTEAEFAAID